MATEEPKPDPAAAEAAAAAPADDAAPAPAEAALAPIIVKKIQDGHGGAHGGAWKIALADMMTAMMAFFLLMWILGATNDSQRKSIADYFKPTSATQITMSKMAGSNSIMGGASFIDPDGLPLAAKQTSLFGIVRPNSQGGTSEGDASPKEDGKGAGKEDAKGKAKDGDELSEEEKKKVAAETDKANFDKLEKETREHLAENPSFQKIQEQVSFVREKEGLRIEIIDKADFSMFASGTTQMPAQAKALIAEVTKSLSAMPNKLSVRGHTDSVAFANSDGRNNWSLSAERAETTRAMLEKGGIKKERFHQIEGVADTAPYNPNDPKDARNRRISITVRFRE